MRKLTYAGRAFDLSLCIAISRPNCWQSHEINRGLVVPFPTSTVEARYIGHRCCL